MPRSITNSMKTHWVDTFIDHIDRDVNSLHYVFASRSFEWDDDSAPPSVDLSYKGSQIDPRREMVFGVHVSNTDVMPMIAKNEWTSGTVYPMYDHTDTELHTKQFFVVTPEGGDYSVFKCLYNSDGANSTHMPIASETSANDDLYQTSDGYVWKYMFTVPEATYLKFNTTYWMPAVVDTAVAAAAIDGSIDVYTVDTAGGNYNSYANAVIKQTAIGGNTKKFYIQGDAQSLSANTGFYEGCAVYTTQGTGLGQLRLIAEYGTESGERYMIIDSDFDVAVDNTTYFQIVPQVKVEGDGSGALAKAVVNATSNTIHSIEVVSRGSGYTFADVTIIANTGAIDDTNPTPATVTAMISPQGGHGSDPAAELFASAAGISVDFGNTVPSGNNDFRRIGLLLDPTFGEVVLTVNSAIGFSSNDTVVQATTGATGSITSVNAISNEITLNTVKGIFTAPYSISANATTTEVNTVDRDLSTFDQRLVINIKTALTVDTFEIDEMVVQEGTNASGYVYEANSTVMTLTNISGSFANTEDSVITGQTTGAQLSIQDIEIGDVVPFSGKVLYVENMQPITRDGSTDRIKIVIGF